MCKGHACPWGLAQTHGRGGGGGGLLPGMPSQSLQPWAVLWEEDPGSKTCRCGGGSREMSRCEGVAGLASTPRDTWTKQQIHSKVREHCHCAGNAVQGEGYP